MLIAIEYKTNTEKRFSTCITVLSLTCVVFAATEFKQFLIMSEITPVS